jgi:hypothetical protein
MKTPSYTSLLLVAVLSSMPATALGQLVSPFPGVSFQLPVGFVAQPVQAAPVVAAWRAPDTTVVIQAIATGIPYSAAAARELLDWPGVARSMAAGLGNSALKVMYAQLGVSCSYVGLPLQHDLFRMAIEFRVDFSCPSKPNAYALRSVVIAVLTQSSESVLRLDAYPGNAAIQDSVVSGVWNTLAVSENQRVDMRSIGQSGGAGAPVRGGPGIRLRDYGLINTPALIGEAAGSVVGALLFGALFTLIFLKVRIRPLPARFCHKW